MTERFRAGANVYAGVYLHKWINIESGNVVMTEADIREKVLKYGFRALGIQPGGMPTVAEWRALQRIIEMDKQDRAYEKMRQKEPTNGLFIED